tara:strand:- start:2346 stop:2696 length:351 start_codon:yes stop_codon:yes gene_type:complete
MSTLKVNAFQDTSGKGFYPARAWVNFNGTSTVAIRDDGNVSSITDNGTGDYSVTLTNNFGDTNGSITYGGRRSSSLTSLSYWQQIYQEANGSIRVRVGTGGTGSSDHDIISINMFR